jgi:hypothetical protein
MVGDLLYGFCMILRRLQYSFVNLIFYAQYKTLSLVPNSCVGKVLSFQIKVKEYWSLQYAIMF